MTTTTTRTEADAIDIVRSTSAYGTAITGVEVRMHDGPALFVPLAWLQEIAVDLIGDPDIFVQRLIREGRLDGSWIGSSLAFRGDSRYAKDESALGSFVVGLLRGIGSADVKDNALHSA